MDFIFLAYFQQNGRILLNFCVFTGFENGVSTIEPDGSSLTCTDTKHRMQHSKLSQRTTGDKVWLGCLDF